MSNNAAETLVGAIVVAVAAGFLFYASQTAGLSGSADRYPLVAEFRSIEGVSVGTDVHMAGVKIGTVSGIKLSRETFQARVTLSLEQGIEIPEDSEARISSEGLLGGSYVELVPGGSEIALAGGEEILNTQSAVSLLNLLLKFAGNAANE
ncbi:MAG: outer membrane lipid asymmetry maintenance protein MlaD [Paracoccaceae bacterium]